MVAYQTQFRRAEDQYIADRRQRELQKTRDWEASRQRQREQKFWDERAAYVKRVTTLANAAADPMIFLIYPSQICLSGVTGERRVR
jgi:hypothetical protein